MTEPSTTVAVRKSSVAVWGLVACPVIAVALRVIVVLAQSDQLTRDRDAYLGIAVSVAEGRGYSSPDSTTPTAFRPPLYPLILAVGIRFLSPAIVVGFVNVLAAAVTIWLTIALGRNLGLGSLRMLAALLVAIDPLLLQYSAQPMTESLCTMLAALWLWTQSIDQRSVSFGPRLRATMSGFVFGLLVLCRPTFWPLAGLCAVGWWINRRETRIAASSLLDATLSVVATLLTVAPWVLRNWYVFGTPILMTTHGGYTLILGNNSSFYRDEVQQPWGTVWPGDSQQMWETELNARMLREIGNDATELQRDAWLSRQARQFMMSNPGPVLHATVHRIRSLWKTTPQRENPVDERIRRFVQWFYTIELTAAVIGIILVAAHATRYRWLPLLILIISVQAVHLVYWTNTRMRAPLTPPIALLATAAICRLMSRPAEQA